jgi:GntR family transcriptional regulator / MocR family aminotransferase
MTATSPGRKSWASSGIDLHLDLDLSKRPRHELEESLREAIRAGRLPAGTRLPSTRALAADLRVARGTVAEAYAQLTAEGWIAARPRSGTVVAGSVPAVASAAPAAPAPAQPDLRAGLDLRPGNCDLSTFPRSAWSAALRRALSHTPHHAFGYSDHRGWIELRQELSVYLARTRGVRTDPDHLVITTGFNQSLALTSRALAANGLARLAMENPCLPHHRDVVRAAGLQVVPIAVDAQGVDAAAIEGHPGTLRAVLVAPACQFPLGACLSPHRRTQLLAWAQAHGGYLIEDDYDGEFRYDRQPVGALQGLNPDHVIYAGTTSKTLAPGLRVGWLALPDRLLDEVVRQKHLADGQTATLTQIALAELIRSGAFDRHIRRMRLHYRHRRDLLLRELASRAPHVRVGGVAAGFTVALTMPDGWDEDHVVRQAARRGLAIHGLTADGYYAGRAEPRPARLVINYAAPPQHAYPAAVAALADALTVRPLVDPA